MKNINRLVNTKLSMRAPSSKAHTLRALLIASLAQGVTKIINPLLGDDQLNLIECLRGLGVHIDVKQDVVIVKGVNGRYQPIREKLNVGESGVAMNFLASAACLSETPVVITGTTRLTERPILEVVNGLRQLGCQIDYLNKEGFPPVRINSNKIQGGTALINGEKTSQYFSSIALVSPFATNPVNLKCLDRMSERPYFDISLDMMSNFGVQSTNNNYAEICVKNGQKYTAHDMAIEGDFSSASFFFLAAAICKTRVMIHGLNPNSKQGDKRFLELLNKMGCTINSTDEGILIHGSDLQAITEDMRDTPDLVPPIAIAAAHAHGISRFLGVGHLRHKECDRLAVMVSELGKLGVIARCNKDTLEVEGCNSIHGGTIDPHNDHRIAMSFAIEGLVRGDIVVKNENCVAKSFPDFWEKFEAFTKPAVKSGLLS
jgi:3-phosphoshikimate 1-carboxyvinyltransferase